jgi:hypothetical protein
MECDGLDIVPLPIDGDDIICDGLLIEGDDTICDGLLIAPLPIDGE